MLDIPTKAKGDSPFRILTKKKTATTTKNCNWASVKHCSILERDTPSS